MKRTTSVRSAGAETPSLAELKRSLTETKGELNRAYTAFDYASDPDLTESWIFTIRALRARMDYLVKRIKEQEQTVAAVAVGRARWM